MGRQSAVDWLWRWINDNQEATIEEGNIAFEQAKQLEKEQQERLIDETLTAYGIIKNSEITEKNG